MLGMGGGVTGGVEPGAGGGVRFNVYVPFVAPPGTPGKPGVETGAGGGLALGVTCATVSAGSL